MPRGRHNGHLRSGTHPRWNRGKILSQEGYVKVRVGCEHPLADPNGYVYEHLIVWVSAGYCKPEEGWILHHVNGDRLDNRIENLRLMPRDRHNAIHNQERGRDDAGRFVGKRVAGRLLDGREWNELPEVSHG